MAVRGRPVRPGWRTVRASQNRLREKQFLAHQGFPLAPWRPVRTHEELIAATGLGLPLILKTASSGYDGKGQIRVTDPREAEPAWSSLGRVDCVAEAWVSFGSEVSVVVVRGRGWSGADLPGRSEPARTAHSRRDDHARPRGPGCGPRARCLALGVARGAWDRWRPDGRILRHRLGPIACE